MHIVCIIIAISLRNVQLRAAVVRTSGQSCDFHCQGRKSCDFHCLRDLLPFPNMIDCKTSELRKNRGKHINITGLQENWPPGVAFAKLQADTFDTLISERTASGSMVDFMPLSNQLSLRKAWDVRDNPARIALRCHWNYGNKTFAHMINVYVYLLDVNDHLPTVALSTELSLAEDTMVGTDLWPVQSLDGDPTNLRTAVVRVPYVLDWEYFHYDASSKMIILHRELDYETRDQIQFQLQVTDHHPKLPKYVDPSGSGWLHETHRTNQMNFTVHVTNVDDETCRFSHSLYAATIRPADNEGDVVQPSVNISAADADDLQQVIKYFFVKSDDSSDDATNYYRIEPLLAVVRLKKNAWTRGAVRMRIQACGTRLPIRCCYALLNVNVTNNQSQSDIAFGKYTYNTDVVENTPLGSDVLRVRVNRADSMPYIWYFLDRASQTVSTFTMEQDRKSGQLKLSLDLDYEKRQTYEFRVFAFNGEFTASAEVVIHVLDYNEFDAQFVHNAYNFTSDRLIGSNPGRLDFTDADLSSRHEFLLSAHEHLFDVNGSGHLLLIAYGGAYRERKYDLTATLLDKTPPLRRTTVNVTIHLRGEPPEPVLAPVQPGMTAGMTAAVPVVVGVFIAVVGIFVYTKGRRLKSELQDKKGGKTLYVPGRKSARQPLTRSALDRRKKRIQNQASRNWRRRTTPNPRPYVELDDVTREVRRLSMKMDKQALVDERSNTSNEKPSHRSKVTSRNMFHMDNPDDEDDISVISVAYHSVIESPSTTSVQSTTLPDLRS